MSLLLRHQIFRPIIAATVVVVLLASGMDLHTSAAEPTVGLRCTCVKWLDPNTEKYVDCADDDPLKLNVNVIGMVYEDKGGSHAIAGVKGDTIFLERHKVTGTNCTASSWSTTRLERRTLRHISEWMCESADPRYRYSYHEFACKKVPAWDFSRGRQL